jgi:protein N-terminal methyltransferase
MKLPPSQSPFKARKMVHFHLSTLQSFDPSMPYTSSVASHSKLSKRPKLEAAGEPQASFPTTYSVLDAGEVEETGSKDISEPIRYDVIWCQWCLQHLSDRDLVTFLKKSVSCLVEPTSAPSTKKESAVLDGSGIIVVKENVLRDEADGNENVWYDDEDHSITRTSNAYERVFKEAGLQVVKTQLQLGLPEELFPVRIWCLRSA